MTDWITEWLQQNEAEIDRLADTIFTHPETAGEETQSAAALENFLQKNGFSVSKNTAGLPTAFTAEKGKGEPRIAFLAEYDALPNLGQNPRTAILFPETGMAAGITCWVPVLRRRPVRWLMRWSRKTCSGRSWFTAARRRKSAGEKSLWQTPTALTGTMRQSRGIRRTRTKSVRKFFRR